MDDKDLGHRILKFISSKPKKLEATAKIAQALRVPKKSLNNSLYKLMKEGQLLKVQITPPVWGLAGEVSLSQSSSPARITRGRSGASDVDNNECTPEKEIVRKVHQYLKGKKKPAKSLEIAKAAGFSRVTEINATLYHLQKRNIIEKQATKPPTWILVRHAAEDAELFGTVEGSRAQIGFAGAISLASKSSGRKTITWLQRKWSFYDRICSNSAVQDVTQVASSSNYEQGPTGYHLSTEAGSIPIFQDTQLFNTDLSFETDNSDLFETENMSGAENFDEGIDRGFGSDEEGGTNSPNRNALFGDGWADVKEDVSGNNGSFNINADIPREEVSDTEEGYCVTNLKMEDETSYETETINELNADMLREEDSDIEEGHCVKRQKMEDQTPFETETINEFGLNLAESEITNIITDKPKPKTFRQMFNLDDPILDEDSSQSFSEGMQEDTAGEYDENEGQNESEMNPANSTPEMPMLKQETEENTPNLPVLEIEKVTPETAISSNGNVMETPNIVNSVLDMETEIVTSYAEMNEIPKHSSKLEVVSDSSIQAPGEMEDCDKVLEVLAAFPGTTQFVLKKKTEFSSEKLDEVMKKCESLNYVSGSARLWKITQEGDDYFKNKSNVDSSSSSKNDNAELAPRQKLKFQGPPPPPMAILKGKGISVGATTTPKVSPRSGAVQSFNTCALSQSMQKPQFPSSNQPGSYHPAPPSTHMLDSTTKSTQDTSRTEPKPLMSIAFPSKSSQVYTGPHRVESKVASSSKMPLFPSQIAQKQRSGTVNSLNDLDMSTSQPYSSPTNRSMNQSNFQNIHKSEMTQSNFGNNQNVNQSNLNSGLWDMGSHSKYQEHNTNFQRTSVVSSQNAAPPPSSLFSPNIGRQSNKSNIHSFKQPDIQPPQREIPKEYADYPNQSASMQCLKTKTPKQLSAKLKSLKDPSKSAFNKGPPPSPLDILLKGLKKTDISPSRITESAQTMNQQSASIPSQTLSSVFSRPEPPSRQTLVNQSGTQNMFNSGIQSFGNNKPMNQSYSMSQMGSLSQNSTGSLLNPQQRVKSGAANQHLALSTESFAALNKNPVSALMEYAQTRKLVAHVEVLGRRGSAHKPTFELAAYVGERKFPSIMCSNKKEGRKEACDIAMRQLVAEGQFQAESGAGSTMSKPLPSLDNMTHFDKIAALSHRGFTALVSQITAESFAGRKVIAGLVMKRSEADTGVLVSLGSGNRCITGPQLSLQGNTINDSHAEIITRRGFIRFLYKQLLDYDPSKPSPMFERSASGKLQIKSNITFHLYISTAPCGDGALFSPRDAESSKGQVDTRVRPPHNPTFSNNVQGLLRTKVEGGEGTIPVEPGFNGQTFDGIQRGERLRTMSCTDKICRWNVVGMQGALLSHFLEPVYLDSLTLGLLYDHGHLSRAVCCRVEKGSTDISTQLPQGYRLNHPWLGRVTVCDPPREVQKTKALSINWSFGDKGPEVTDGTLGLCYTSIEKGFFSRCTKRNLFTSFKALCEKTGRHDLLQVTCYKDAKMKAQDFQAAREAMLAKFKSNNYGKWVSKPVEEEMFQFDEQNS